MKRLALALLVLSACSQSPSGYPFVPEISEDDMYQMVSFLADDSLKGREAGSPEAAIAATYLADHFQFFGLEPAGTDGTYFQEFSLVKGVRETEEGSRIQTGDVEFTSKGGQLLPWAYSEAGEAGGTLIFAGYGIQSKNLNYNDYEGLDLAGKVVMIMRYGPDGADNPHTDFGTYWDLRSKVKTAEELGASAILLFRGPNHNGVEEFESLEFDRMVRGSRIPVLQMSASAATQLAQLAGFSLTTLQQRIDSRKKPASFTSDLPIRLYVGIEKNKVIARNVIAKVEGKKPELKPVIIGGHFDHLGYGHFGSLYRGDEAKIHNGADDNASGTSGVLELAHYFSANRPERSIYFMAYSGEELGLLGSDYFVNHPTFELENAKAMINMDMIGRLQDDKLQIFGTGSSADWETTITAANVDSLNITMTPDGVGASDHTSFYNKQIPVLHYFTGTHADYHRPSDDTEYLNFSGQAQVLKHIIRVIEQMDGQSDDFLAYKEAPNTQTRRMRMKGITLGVLPDYAFTGEGFRITGVTEGRLGSKLGLKAGDVITDINGEAIRDIYDYMESLATIKKGKTCTVVVQREDETLTLKATPE